MISRNITKVTDNPWHRGFLGAGHSAKAVLGGAPFKETDPFILFMDDRLDLPGGEPVGGAHPHAGFETLTLVLEGNHEEWQTGSFELMTAGKGIVHTEQITARAKVRILQVWLVLRPEKRYVQPFWQKILLKDVPKIKTGEYEVRVYSGSSNGLTSPIKNQTPFTLVDFTLHKDIEVSQEIPAHYNGLIYVIHGSIKVGNETIGPEKAGWLDRPFDAGNSVIKFKAAEDNTRFLLYAGEPGNSPITTHGPFVADSMEDISKMYRDYRAGEFPHLNDLPAGQKKVF